MRTRDIKAVLRQRLAQGGHGLPINWPNENFNGARPRLEASFSGLGRQGGALEGGKAIEHHSGLLNIALVSDEGSGSGNADDLADDIAELFTEGHRYAITGGNVAIQLSEVRDGFNAGGEWRVPIVIRFVTET